MAASDRGREASPPSGAAPPALEVIGIEKWFGTVHANSNVNVRVAPGTIHGIIGENGAGKSTLMSVVYGYYQADSGEIRVGGEPVQIKGPEHAIAAGIGMVHQHFMLVDTFTVLENIVLGVEGGRMLAPSLAAARSELQRLERDYNLEVNPDAIVGELPVGVQQRVEILKALYRGADILILDEPTGVLTPQEVDHLFRILAALREQGKTIILITHKLREIMALTDEVTVMRGGEVVAQVMTAETTREDLAAKMVGRSVLLRVEKGAAHPGAAFLEVADLCVNDHTGLARVKNVSFEVHAGEILGIAGVAGNGQSELMAALAGILPKKSGHILIKGEEIAGGTARGARNVRAAGVGHVPEDRQHMGLVTSFEACESGILGYHRDEKYNGRVLMDHTAIVADVGRQMEEYDVRPPLPRLRTGAFSGGNQQKIVLGREMDRDPDVLLVGQPTRGVDIGAIEFIHRRLVAMRDAGKALLLVSVELDEILSLSDRILVMFDGEIVGEVTQSEATEQALGLMMAGERQTPPQAPTSQENTP
ncbi:MAG: ABC transporter ATP-binding protein [Rhodospirillaceae bacterium]|nr:ABC transporter ATP-binding protein [Rhodospirillaceae bacterium]MBT5780874.1 ABC transporter ATP-binding protein [Rhodospirillaceae bacterium]